jgi:hypothetical protein
MIQVVTSDKLAAPIGPFSPPAAPPRGGAL